MAGTIEDYSDIINKYHNNELSFNEYCKEFYKREKEVSDRIDSKKPKLFDFINQQIITNN